MPNIYRFAPVFLRSSAESLDQRPGTHPSYTIIPTLAFSHCLVVANKYSNAHICKLYVRYCSSFEHEARERLQHAVVSAASPDEPADPILSPLHLFPLQKQIQ